MILEGNEGLKVYAQNNVLSNEETKSIQTIFV